MILFAWLAGRGPIVGAGVRRMAITTQERKEALAAAAEQELKGLEARGVRMAGNAF